MISTGDLLGDRVVGRPPCKLCGRPTELTEYGEQIWAEANAMARKLGYAALTEREIVKCDLCWRRRLAGVEDVKNEERR